MTTGGGRALIDDGPLSPLVRRPTSLLVVLAMLALLAATGVCLGLDAAALSRVDLLHATFLDACTPHAYEWHWQRAGRFPRDLRYNFFYQSPDSLIALEIWVTGRETISFSQRLPLPCG